MPSLVLVTPDAGTAGEFELDGRSHLIGRRASAGCDIVLNHKAVSKVHARVTADGGRFFVTDAGGKNGTRLNGIPLLPNVKTPLKPGDRIVICDFQLVFHDDDVPCGPVAVARDTSAAPDARLGALLALGTDPARAGEPAPLWAGELAPLRALVAEALFGGEGPDLDRIADTLLGVFPQCDRCIVLTLDAGGWPVPEVTRDRAGGPRAPFCRSLAMRAVESRQSYVAETAPGPGGEPPRSVVCVPLFASDGHALGAVLLDARAPGRRFTDADLTLAGIVANLAAVAIEKARTQAEIKARAKEQSDLSLARGVQLGFLPPPPVVPGYEFFTHYSPAQKVGGDYYDFVPLPDGRLAIVVGDVSGHGVAAALLVAKLSSEVRTCLLRTPDAARAVRALNRALIDGGVGEMFVTFVAMVLDRDRHAITVVNAGHPSPKLYRAATRTLTDLIADDDGGLALGWDPDYAYAAVTVELQPHDTVTAFTDGVTEAMDPNGHRFGAEAARQIQPDVARDTDPERPKATGERLLMAVQRHLAGRAQSDDIAVVAFGRWESEPITADLFDRRAGAFEEPD